MEFINSTYCKYEEMKNNLYIMKNKLHLPTYQSFTFIYLMTLHSSRDFIKSCTYIKLVKISYKPMTWSTLYFLSQIENWGKKTD